MGYVKKGSTSSLYAGSTFGLLLILCGILILQKKTKYIGITMAGFFSALLSAAMTYRFSLSGKMMPSGMVAIIALFSFFYHTIQCMRFKMVTTSSGKEITSLRWWQGFIIASVFSTIYLLTPMYLFSAVVTVIMQYPTKNISLIYAAPVIISMMFPSTPMLWLAKYMTPMLDYFDYEEISEFSNEEALKMINGERNFIIVMQPHGSVSYFSLNLCVFFLQLN